MSGPVEAATASARLPVVPIALVHAESFHAALDAVAREQRYLAQTQAPPLEQVRRFVQESVEKDAVQFVALDGARVVGWADVFPDWPAAIAHRGHLGMGVLAAYRRRGLGRRLLQACIDKAWARGLMRIELETRADNAAALALYAALGFAHEGVRRQAMRFDGRGWDTVAMGLLRPDAA